MHFRFSTRVLTVVLLVFCQKSIAQDIAANLLPAPGLAPDVQAKISEKLTEAFGKHKIGTKEQFSDIVIAPSATFTPGRSLNPKSAAGKLMVVGQLSFSISHRNGQFFGNFYMKDGSTATSDTAARAAFAENLNLADTRFDSVAMAAKHKIAEYFDANCPILVEDARQKAGLGNFKSAFSTLVSLPANCKCRAQADSLFSQLYATQREQFFQFFFEKAEKAANGKDPLDALEPLRRLDPESESMAKADKLVNTLNRRLGDEERAQLEELRENWPKKPLSPAAQKVIWRAYLIEQ